jgi:hypothetical protein
LLVRRLNALAATISTPLGAAWLTCAAVAHNLLRVAGALASLAYGKACGATIRRDLIDVAARTARHGRGHITLHLPAGWCREHEWMTLFTATCGPGSSGLTSPDPGHCTLHGLGSPPSRPPNTNPGTRHRKVNDRKRMPISAAMITSAGRKIVSATTRIQPVD